MICAGRLLKEPLAFFRSLRDQLEAGGDPRTDSLERLASASVTLGSLIDEIGDKEDALRVYQNALALWDRLARTASRAGDIQSRLAETHDSISRLQHDLGRLSDALRSAALARDIKRRLAHENPNDSMLQSDLAESHNKIGLMFAATGATRYALEFQELAREIRERLVREHPDVAEFQQNLAQGEDNIRLLQTRMGLRTPHLHNEPGESLAAYTQRLKIQERLARENPSEIEHQRALAQIHNNIGNLQHQTGKPKHALVSHLKALVIRVRLAGDAPSVVRSQRDLAQSHFNIGNLHVTIARYTRYGHDVPDDLSSVELPCETLSRDDQSLIAACYRAFFHGFMGHIHEGLLSHERERQIRIALAREKESFNGSSP